MKKKRNQPKNRTRANAPDPVDQAKRKSLKLLRNTAVGVVAAGGIGTMSVRAVRATIAEQDLSVVGQGLPMVVQVHDPQCALCTELQREARKALRGFDADMLGYRVANIMTDSGAAFAARHGAAHVTLLLFDGDGNLVDQLVGVRPRDELERRFQALAAGN